MVHIFNSPAELGASLGQTFGPTEWLVVDQDRINKFADATGDRQWIHVDPERAKTGPFGSTIAHGFLTLSLTNLFLPELIEVHGISMGLNYGLNKIRFPAIVPAGSRIRAKSELISVENLAGGAIQSIFRITVEVEGGTKPACVAEAISMWYPA
ncbi:MAG: MaoC-like dehydratase [Rhodospirillales bacterium]|nr:MaoC-like dehydratase [Rhodospirillales bacterium]